MSAYARNIAIIVVVCHVFSMLVPGTSGIKKTYRFFCGLVVLIVIAAPLHEATQEITEMIQSLQKVLPNEGNDVETTESARFSSVIEATVLGWMQYISIEYTIPVEDMDAVIYEDGGTIMEMQLFIRGITEEKGKEIEMDLRERMEAEITVWEKAEKEISK